MCCPGTALCGGTREGGPRSSQRGRLVGAEIKEWGCQQLSPQAWTQLNALSVAWGVPAKWTWGTMDGNLDLDEEHERGRNRGARTRCRCCECWILNCAAGNILSGRCTNSCCVACRDDYSALERLRVDLLLGCDSKVAGVCAIEAKRNPPASGPSPSRHPDPVQVQGHGRVGRFRAKDWRDCGLGGPGFLDFWLGISSPGGVTHGLSGGQRLPVQFLPLRANKSTPTVSVHHPPNPHHGELFVVSRLPLVALLLAEGADAAG
jgi:hypothetical protein